MNEVCGEAAAVIILVVGFGALGGGLTTYRKTGSIFSLIAGTIVGLVFIGWSIYAYFCSP